MSQGTARFWTQGPDLARLFGASYVCYFVPSQGEGHETGDGLARTLDRLAHITRGVLPVVVTGPAAAAGRGHVAPAPDGLCRVYCELVADESGAIEAADVGRLCELPEPPPVPCRLVVGTGPTGPEGATVVGATRAWLARLGADEAQPPPVDSGEDPLSWALAGYLADLERRQRETLARLVETAARLSDLQLEYERLLNTSTALRPLPAQLAASQAEVHRYRTALRHQLADRLSELLSRVPALHRAFEGVAHLIWWVVGGPGRGAPRGDNR